MNLEERTYKLLNESLISEDSKEKYLNILDKRIEENRKSIGNLFLILIFSALAFNLLLQTKISEINIGPITITDNKVIFSLIPSIFTLVYHKYLMIWIEITEQKRIYNSLSSILFSIDKGSFLNNKIKPFSITDSMIRHQSNDKGLLGCLTNLIWVPIGLFVFFIAFFYEFYLIYKLFQNLNPSNIFEWFLFICPIMISIYTIVTLLNAIRNEIKKEQTQI